ncbi:MAG: thermonuclease family protein [Terricaulis sp.]
MLTLLILSAGLLLSDPRVVDGDTLHDDPAGEYYRVENLDAPELGRRAACASEADLGQRAKDAVTAWVAEARQIEALPIGRRDRFGRIVARIELDGVDLGDRLIATGLAVRWTGRKHNFCAG